MTSLFRLFYRGKRLRRTSGKRSGFARGSVTQLSSFADRIEARVLTSGNARCHYQHIPYERQLEFKAGILPRDFAADCEN